MRDQEHQLGKEDLERGLRAVGEVLAHRGARVEVAIVGGTGLLLLGVVQRTTTDVDVVAWIDGGALRSANPLPAELGTAAHDVALALGLGPKWFNSGPTALLDFGLPRGFLERCTVIDYGGLVVHIAGRLDQIHFKLYATTDQGPRSKHMSDLRALKPSRDELVAAAYWCRTHDPSEGFLMSLRGALRAFDVGDFDATR